MIKFEDWKKLDIRVGEVLKVERLPKTDKLYKLQVDVGKEKSIQIVTGLVPYYNKEELKNKKIIVIVNLESEKFAGEVSNGMLLAADDKKGNIGLLVPERDIDSGSRVE